MVGRLPSLKLAGTGRAQDSAYQALRQAILGGTLPPGERLVERDVAARLGISRTPVREAIQRLAAEQLVAKSGRGGAVVRGMSRREVNEIFALRAALEGLLCRMAAEVRTAQQLASAQSLLMQMQAAAAGGDVGRYHKANGRFHDLLYRAANSARIHKYSADLAEHTARFTERSFMVSGRLSEATREHAALVAAIAARDGEAAEALARAHIDHSRAAYFASLVPDM